MKNINSYTAEPTKKDIESLEKDFQYVHDAQDNLLKKLFDFIPERPGDYTINRTTYIKAMIEVQHEFQLEEGDPRLVLFVLEQLSHSPKIIDYPKASQKHKNKSKR